MQLSEAKTILCNRFLGIDYADISNNQLFSDADLTDYINLAILRVWDYKPWDFTEGAKTFTISPSDFSSGYIDHPVDIVFGSIYLLRIGGKEFKKIRFADYMKTFEQDSGCADRIWTEYNGFIFANRNAFSIGDTADFFGKKTAPALSNGTELLPFSPTQDNYEYSGNQTIVLLAYSSILESDKKKNPTQAQAEEVKAFRILDSLWGQFAQNRGQEQFSGRPMFNVPDFFKPKGSKPFTPGNF